MQLAQLPSEVLDFIVSPRPSSQIALALWKCGDKLLNSKLSTGVTNFDLQVAQQHHIRAPMPRIPLNFRRLRLLSIKSIYNLAEHLSEWPTLLSSFPATLEKLELSSPDSIFAILNHAPESTVFALKTIQTNYKRGPSRLLDLEALFPRLDTLKIGFHRTQSTFDLDDCAGLPSSLRYFEALIRIQPSNWPKLLLPPSIRFIGGLGYLSNDLAVFPEWPSTALPELEEMSFTWGEVNSSLFSFSNKWLPRSLTKCNLVFDWDFETSRSVPSTLQTLGITTVKEHSFESQGRKWYFELPQHLTSLSFDMRKVVPKAPLNLAHFPISLTSLVAHGCLFDTSSNTPVLPSLKYFQASVPVGTLPLALPKASPLRSLESLVVWNTDVREEDEKILVDVDALPPTLRSLELVAHSSTPLEFSRPLPSNLQLILTGHLLGENLIHLPSSLKSLNVTLLRLSASDTVKWKFPSCLKKLLLNTWHCDGMASLPKTLTSLTIANLLGVRDSFTADGSLFEQLPASLTLLNLSSLVNAQALPTPRLSHLKELKVLRLLGLGHFKSNFLRELPRDLDKLFVTLNSIEIEDAPFLPPKLTFIAIGMKITFKYSWLGQYWPLFAVMPPAELQPTLQKRLLAYAQ